MLLSAVGISLLMTLLLIGCQSGASQSTTALSGTTSVPTTVPTSTTSVASSTTTTTQVWETTSTLFSSPPSTLPFVRELFGEGYDALGLDTVQEGDTIIQVVRVLVDPGRETQATYDAIYEHAIVLAKKYGIADATGGRLRVLLLEASLERKVLGSRDFSVS